MAQHELTLSAADIQFIANLIDQKSDIHYASVCKTLISQDSNYIAQWDNNVLAIYRDGAEDQGVWITISENGDMDENKIEGIRFQIDDKKLRYLMCDNSSTPPVITMKSDLLVDYSLSASDIYSNNDVIVSEKLTANEILAVNDINAIGDIKAESDLVVQGDIHLPAGGNIYVPEGGEMKPLAQMTGQTVDGYDEEYVPSLFNLEDVLLDASTTLTIFNDVPDLPNYSTVTPVFLIKFIKSTMWNRDNLRLDAFEIFRYVDDNGIGGYKLINFQHIVDENGNDYWEYTEELDDEGNLYDRPMVAMSNSFYSIRDCLNRGEIYIMWLPPRTFSQLSSDIVTTGSVEAENTFQLIKTGVPRFNDPVAFYEVAFYDDEGFYYVDWGYEVGTEEYDNVPYGQDFELYDNVWGNHWKLTKTELGWTGVYDSWYQQKAEFHDMELTGNLSIPKYISEKYVHMDLKNYYDCWALDPRSFTIQSYFNTYYNVPYPNEEGYNPDINLWTYIIDSYQNSQVTHWTNKPIFCYQVEQNSDGENTFIEKPLTDFYFLICQPERVENQEQFKPSGNHNIVVKEGSDREKELHMVYFNINHDEHGTYYIHIFNTDIQVVRSSVTNAFLVTVTQTLTHEDNKIVFKEVPHLQQNEGSLFRYIWYARQCTLIPDPSSASFLYTPYNIVSDGVVQGMNVQTYLYQLNKIGHNQDSLMSSMNVVQAQMSQLIPIVETMYETLASSAISTNDNPLGTFLEVIADAVMFIPGIGPSLSAGLQICSSFISGIGEMGFGGDGSVDVGNGTSKPKKGIDGVINESDVAAEETSEPETNAVLKSSIDKDKKIMTAAAIERLIDKKLNELEKRINEKLEAFFNQ